MTPLPGMSPPTRPSEYERMVIEANRRMAELRITRVDFRGQPDGLERFKRLVEAMG